MGAASIRCLQAERRSKASRLNVERDHSAKAPFRDLAPLLRRVVLVSQAALRQRLDHERVHHFGDLQPCGCGALRGCIVLHG
jgi:hypothetical protein